MCLGVSCVLIDCLIGLILQDILTKRKNELCTHTECSAAKVWLLTHELQTVPVGLQAIWQRKKTKHTRVYTFVRYIQVGICTVLLCLHQILNITPNHTLDLTLCSLLTATLTSLLLLCVTCYMSANIITTVRPNIDSKLSIFSLHWTHKTWPINDYSHSPYKIYNRDKRPFTGTVKFGYRPSKVFL